MKKVVSLLMAWYFAVDCCLPAGHRNLVNHAAAHPQRGTKMNTLRKLSIIVQTALLIAHSVLGQQQRTIPPR